MSIAVRMITAILRLLCCAYLHNSGTWRQCSGQSLASRCLLEATCKKRCSICLCHMTTMVSVITPCSYICIDFGGSKHLSNYCSRSKHVIKMSILTYLKVGVSMHRCVIAYLHVVLRVSVCIFQNGKYSVYTRSVINTYLP